MRKIKFRAWDKNRRKMASVEGLYNPFSEEDSRTRIILNFDDYIQEKIFSKNCIALMQHTGLKDSNGVEIYEGDIVLESLDRLVENSQKATLVVGWSFSNCSYNVMDVYEYEVIGNVYEHPHLIE